MLRFRVRIFIYVCRYISTCISYINMYVLLKWWGGMYCGDLRYRAKTMRLMCEHLPRLGYGGPTHWLLLCLSSPLNVYTYNVNCLRLSLCLPALIYSNDVSPSKIFKVQHPYPLLDHVVLFFPAHIRGLGLRPFSALVCDVLPRRLFHGSPKAHCRRVSQSQSWRALLGGH